MGRTNWLAIIACVVAAMAIGFLWYGALFNEQWMAGNGITMEGDNMFKNGIPRPYSNSPMIINTIVMLIYALIMNWLIHKTRDTSVVKGFLSIYQLERVSEALSRNGTFLCTQYSPNSRL